MLLNKTDKARDALGAGPSAGLTMLDRRILILTDGKRSLNQVMAMLGADILPAIDRLLREGYITWDDVVAASRCRTHAALGGAVTGLLRAATEAVQARTEQIRAARRRLSHEAAPIDGRRRHRRNCDGVAHRVRLRARAARSPPARCTCSTCCNCSARADAAERRAAIQCERAGATGRHAVPGAAAADGHEHASSYGERIGNRLAEILPEDTCRGWRHCAPNAPASHAERRRA